MRFSEVSNYTQKRFYRLTGVKRSVFDLMEAALRTKSQLHPLIPEQKQQNKQLAARRIVAEHAVRYLKRFRILKDTYRNHRKRFRLRLNLLAAITNLQR